MRLRIAWATDPGLEREENEDSVAVWRHKAGLDTLIVVCDGMGGHAAGQEASSLAVGTVTKVLAEDGEEGPDVERLKRACSPAFPQPRAGNRIPRYCRVWCRPPTPTCSRPD